MAAKPFHFEWITDNEKVESVDGIGFAIPALRSADGFQTCPGAGVCATLCFARKGWFTRPETAARMEHNLGVLLSNMNTPAVLADMFVEDLLRHPSRRTVRWDISGDFFSQAFLDVVYEVARRTPDRHHYSYTKSLNLDLWSNKPENFVIVQSQGGRYDHLIDPSKPTARIFPTLEALIRAGYSNGQHSDGPAARGEARVGLVFHGGRLTDAVRRLLDSVELPPPPPPASRKLPLIPPGETTTDSADSRTSAA